MPHQVVQCVEQGGTISRTRWCTLSNKEIQFVAPGGAIYRTRKHNLPHQVVQFVEQGGTICRTRWYNLWNKEGQFAASGGVRLPDHEVYFVQKRSSRRTRSYNVPRQGGRRSVRQGSLQVDFEVAFEVISKKDDRIIFFGVAAV